MFYRFTHKSEGPVVFNLIHICQRCHHALLNFTGTVLQLCWPLPHYKSTSFKSNPLDCISQDVRVKLLYLDCNSELTLSLLLLQGTVQCLSFTDPQPSFRIISHRLPTTLLICLSLPASATTLREIIKNKL